MKLIVGLGNPGKQYEKTRHNLGFMVVDYYANKKELNFKSNMQGMYAELVNDGEKIILLKPQSYMNLSGDIVRKYCDYYNVKAEDILVIYDDVDFEVGTFKIKRNGSSGGHNGIKDIINKLGTEVHRSSLMFSRRSMNWLFLYQLSKQVKVITDSRWLAFKVVIRGTSTTSSRNFKQ